MAWKIDVIAGSLLRSGILFMEVLHEKICLALSLVLYRAMSVLLRDHN